MALKTRAFWTLLALALSAATIGVLAYGLAAPQATLLGPALARRLPAAGRKEAALTFDDGPSPYTPQILDILRKNHVHATFFLCGENAERYPDLARRIRADGHEIGNHTYSHPYLYLMDRGRIASEIDRTQDALQRITGRRPTLFRPPFGVRWFSLWPLLAQRGLTMVLWSDWGHDASNAAPEIVRQTLAQLQPGAIILMHDGYETHSAVETDRSATVKALPAIIEGARKAGYTFVAVRD